MKAKSSTAEPSASSPKQPETAPPSTTLTPPASSSPTPINEPLTSPASSVTAEELVSTDKDQFPSEPSEPQPGDSEVNKPAPAEPPPAPLTAEEQRKGEAQGRPQLPPSGDPKLDERRARDRARKNANRRPPPDFSDIRGKTGQAPGAVPGAGQAGPEPSPASPAAAPAATPPKPVDYRALSELTFGITTQALARFLGPEWLPKDDAEKNSVTVPLAVWYQSMNLPDLPPGAVVALVAVGYASVRFQAPTTRQKLGGVWNWLKGKFKKKGGHGTAPAARREEKAVQPIDHGVTHDS